MHIHSTWAAGAHCMHQLLCTVAAAQAALCTGCAKSCASARGLRGVEQSLRFGLGGDYPSVRVSLRALGHYI